MKNSVLRMGSKSMVDGSSARRSTNSTVTKVPSTRPVTGTVAEAVEQFKAGTLKKATGPNVDSHAGMGG